MTYEEMLAELPGNRDEFASGKIERIDCPQLENKKILFLGSSVTYGMASLQDGIPEYFRQRFGCIKTKEAISGTTLADVEPDSYVYRLIHNVDPNTAYDMVICQLSTNDASKGLALGEISASKSKNDFDTNTIIGAMEYIIAYSRDTWHCPVLFYTGSRYESANYEAMVVALYKLAAKWSLGVLDLWNSDSFNDIPDDARNLYMTDPIHPTKAGYMKWWCPELEKQLLIYLQKLI